MKMQKRDLQSQVITFEVCFPDSRVQEMLKVAAEEPVYHVIRLRILDGQPYILEHSFMPVDLVTGLTKEILH
ncbi:UTRA domain-containing protein, partial [Escherichia coli]